MKTGPGSWCGIAACAASLILAGACVDARDRPADPTAPEQEPSVPVSFVQITHPVEGQSVSRVAISQPPGFQVTFTGRFNEGDELLLLVFSDEFPSQAIFAAEAEIEGLGSTASSAHIVLPTSNVILANELEIMMRVLDTDRRAIFTDSVGVFLQ